MLNRVILMGRLTADPELRQTQSGISFVKFNIAVDRKFKNITANIKRILLVLLHGERLLNLSANIFPRDR